MNYSIVNDGAGRKATLSAKGVLLFKMTGNVRKSEHQVWPIIQKGDLSAIALTWIKEGKICLR